MRFYNKCGPYSRLRLVPQPEEVLLLLFSEGNYEVEKETGPNIEQRSSGLCSVCNPFQEFCLFPIYPTALKLAMLPKIPDFPVSTSQVLEGRG